MTRLQCLAWAAHYAALAFWSRSIGLAASAREMTCESDRYRAAAERIDMEERR